MKSNLALPLAALCAALLLTPFAGCKPKVHPARPGSETPASAPATSAKPAPARISHGQTVKLADYLVPGKTVIFDFTSEFCPPCRALAPRLRKLHADRADLVLVEVDINRPDVRGIDWQSPVARQFNLQSIPHLKVYGPTGKLLAEDSADDSPAHDLVNGWLK